MKTATDDMINTFKYIGAKISSGLMDILFFLLAFFSPAGYVLAAVGFAVMVDTYFGRWRARHHNEKVTSKITRISITNKSIGYMLVVLGAFLMDKAFMNEIISFIFPIQYAVTKAVGLTFCWIEYTSVDESYTAVKGKSISEAFRQLVRGVKVVKDDLAELQKEDKDKE